MGGNKYEVPTDVTSPVPTQQTEEVKQPNRFPTDVTAPGPTQQTGEEGE